MSAAEARPLIAPKPIQAYGPEEFHAYVTGMYALPGRKSPPKAAPGLSVSRTKAGALSIRRAKTRAFAYVTLPEIAALAKEKSVSQAELWTAFKLKGFIITETRMQAEERYAVIKEIPWTK